MPMLCKGGNRWSVLSTDNWKQILGSNPPPDIQVNEVDTGKVWLWNPNSTTTTSGGGGGGTAANTGIIVPLYVDPDTGSSPSSWTNLKTAALSYPNIPFIAVVNPSNPTYWPNGGPDTAADAASRGYTSAMGSFPANVYWAGYCDTEYFETSTTMPGGLPPGSSGDTISTGSVIGAVATYLTWSGVTFSYMFFDDYDIASNPGGTAYNGMTIAAYSEALGNYCHSRGVKAIANPGTNDGTARTGVQIDIWCVYENCSTTASTTVSNAVNSSLGSLSASQACYIIYGLGGYPSETWSTTYNTFITNTYKNFAFLNIGAMGSAGSCPDSPYDEAAPLPVQYANQMGAQLASLQPSSSGGGGTTTTTQGGWTYNTVTQSTIKTFIQRASIGAYSVSGLSSGMLGLGSISPWIITPQSTGNIEIHFSYYLSGATSASNCGLTLYYGTGTAPVQGAAVPGGSTAIPLNTVVPYKKHYFSSASDIRSDGGTSFVYGLAVGTPYWFDFDIAPSTGTIALNNLAIFYYEFT